MATSIRREPKSVYRMNLMAAYTRWPCPQMPMIRYIGTSIASQNT